MRSLPFVCLALSACGTAVPGRLEAPIVGGANDTNDPAIVQFVAHVPGSKLEAACTGSVISPHVVLTAAHCVSPDSVGAGADYFVFTNPVADSSTAAESYRVDQVMMHPKFQLLPLDNTNSREPYDVAVGILTSMPLTVPPISYTHTPLTQASLNRKTRVVGYGVTDPDAGTSAGTRRQGTMTIAALDDLFITLVGGDNSTCHGDSGGPALLPIAGHEAVIGVTSVGPETCMPSLGSINTNTSTMTDFIDGVVNQYDPLGNGGLGAPCTTNRDCASQICGQSGNSTFCTESCDPSNKNACSSAYPCSEVDGEHFCYPPHHGCDLAAGAPAPPLAPLWLLALVALVHTLRKTRASGRPHCSSSTRTPSIIERMPHR